MAEKMNIEDPAQGEAQVLESAAQAAAMPVTVAESPEAQEAIAQSAAAAEPEAAAAPLNPALVPAAPVAPRPQGQPGFRGVQGALRAPSMTQPMRVPFEREQRAQMLWKSMAATGGSPVTALIADRMTGID